MVSISAKDFTPSPKREGNNKFSRRVMHKSGQELVLTGDTSAGHRPIRYYRRGHWASRGSMFKPRPKMMFAMWLALRREGIHLG